MLQIWWRGRRPRSGTTCCALPMRLGSPSSTWWAMTGCERELCSRGAGAGADCDDDDAGFTVCDVWRSTGSSGAGAGTLVPVVLSACGGRTHDGAARLRLSAAAVGVLVARVGLLEARVPAGGGRMEEPAVCRDRAALLPDKVGRGSGTASLRSGTSQATAEAERSKCLPSMCRALRMRVTSRLASKGRRPGSPASTRVSWSKAQVTFPTGSSPRRWRRFCDVNWAAS